jgi:hypothetical protein
LLEISISVLAILLVSAPVGDGEKGDESGDGVLFVILQLPVGF